MRRNLLAAAAAACALIYAAPAGALTIVLQDGGGFGAGTAARDAWLGAARFWDNMFTNNVTVTIKAQFAPLAFSQLAATQPLTGSLPTGYIEQQIKAVAATPLDALATAHLPGLDAGGGIDVITPGYVNPATHQGVDTGYRVFDTNDSANNTQLRVAVAEARALNVPVAPGLTDAQMVFNGSIMSEWDFDPTDGISADHLDFVGLAIHEIGHALGFDSGVDTYDSRGLPARSGVPTTFVENSAFGQPLDLFRYSANPDGFAGGGPLLDWSPGSAGYFSIDGGANPFLGAYFSTGSFNGDGWQASHWKLPLHCEDPELGVMRPAFCDGEQISISALDLAAFDAIGWNPRIDVLSRPDWAMSTRGIAPVPEPAAWALMLAGLGAAGVVIRRRRLDSVAGRV